MGISYQCGDDNGVVRDARPHFEAHPDPRALRVCAHPGQVRLVPRLSGFRVQFRLPESVKENRKKRPIRGWGLVFM